jgi:low temperature requirement protein LtrA
MTNWRWETPRLRDDAAAAGERRTSWLELFQDLVFVAVIAQLSQRLSEHVSWPGVLAFVGLLAPVWWIWLAANVYTERFETEDLSQRVFTLLVMIPVTVMGAAIHGNLAHTSTTFAWGYIGARGVLIFMWVRGGWHNPVVRPTTDRFILGFLIGLSFWVASTLVPLPWRAMLWAAGLLVDVATPVFTFRFQDSLPRFSSRLPERYGLLVVIVLGEAIAAIVHGIARLGEVTPLAIATAVLTLLVVFGVWWVYFDHVMGRPTREPFWRQGLRSYIHLPLVIGIVAYAAGVAEAIALGTHDTPAPVRWLMVSAISLTFVALGLIEWVSDSQNAADRSPTQRMLVRFTAALAVLFIGPGWMPGGVLGLNAALFGCMVGQIADGWFLRQRVEVAEDLAPADGVEPAADGVAMD